MDHIVLLYKNFFFTFGFGIFAFVAFQYLKTRNPIIKSFLLLWTSMTVTAATYVLDYYYIINLDIAGRSFAYNIMLFSILLTGISLPLFVHVLFKIKRKAVIYFFVILSFFLTAAILIPFPENWRNYTIKTVMITIVLSNVYSFINGAGEILKIKDKKNKRAGLLFLSSFLILFLLLIYLDMYGERDSGFLFFPIFYIWIGVFFVAIGLRKLKQPNNKISSIPEDFIEKYKLTKREVEIVSLLIDGLKYKDIAENLFISPGTVSTHVMHIYKKTKTKSKIQLNKKIVHFL